MEIILETRNLGMKVPFNNGYLDILKDINLKVKKEDFLSIMGPSGSGKSTLLYLLGILDTPTQGRVIISGKDISNIGDREQSEMRRKKMGFVFQAYNLIPTLSVEDNILLPIYLDKKDVNKYRKNLDDILEKISLSHKKRQTPLELSGGEQQRVAIGRSLINNPEIILLDEPIGNLDSKNGEAIMELLKLINKENNKTIVQVTHSKESIVYGNKICLIKDGMIEKVGNVE